MNSALSIPIYLAALNRQIHISWKLEGFLMPSHIKCVLYLSQVPKKKHDFLRRLQISFYPF